MTHPHAQPGDFERHGKALQRQASTSSDEEKARPESSVAPPQYNAATAPIPAPGIGAFAVPPPSAAASVPLPQNAHHSYPQYQSQMQNAGTAVGGMIGVMGGGGSVGGDMVMGGVVGGMVGQRLAQAENHAFWSNQAMQYREGRAAGVIPPPEQNPDKKASWWSREGRAQRRAARWERRAKRRDGL